DTITNLKQVSTLAVNGATVKANKLTVEGKEAKKLNYSESAAFTAKNSTVELGSATLNSAKFDAVNSKITIGDLHAENSQMSVTGDLNVSGRMDFYGGTFSADALQVKADSQAIRFCDGAKAEIQTMTMDNGSGLGVGSYGKAADVTVHQLNMKNKSTVTIENGQLNSDQITMDNSTIDLAGD
ncbi:MAG: hypothetical protein UDM29_00280, partial [Dialister sp.]|nr:hypothetical protein [Dialister sp.]